MCLTPVWCSCWTWLIKRLPEKFTGAVSERVCVCVCGRNFKYCHSFILMTRIYTRNQALMLLQGAGGTAANQDPKECLVFQDLRWVRHFICADKPIVTDLNSITAHDVNSVNCSSCRVNIDQLGNQGQLEVVALVDRRCVTSLPMLLMAPSCKSDVFLGFSNWILLHLTLFSQKVVSVSSSKWRRTTSCSFTTEKANST